MAADDTEPKDDSPSEALARSRVAPDLREAMREATPVGGPPRDSHGRFTADGDGVRRDGGARHDRLRVVIEFNTAFPGGTTLARRLLLEGYARLLEGSNRKAPEIDARLLDRLFMMPAGSVFNEVDRQAIASSFEADDEIQISNSLWTENYAFGRLSPKTILNISSLCVEGNPARATRGEVRKIHWRLTSDGKRKGERVALVHRIWRDQPLQSFVYESQRTIKCDAARAAFAAGGEDIVWAVADTGIDAAHPHFATYATLDLPATLRHRDFTDVHDDDETAAAAALDDEEGHGTHVAGIIAGQTPEDFGVCRVVGKVLEVDDSGREKTRDEVTELKRTVSGIAPRCKLLSLKVMKRRKGGSVSHLIAALGYVHRMNDNGRTLKIHGVNLSLGYAFDPNWFAAGQSPLCTEVERLVKNGVVVVVAAGNGGYGTVTTLGGAAEIASHGGTIADPGNAELAITVGATHRDRPHSYGVSFFSAKGPTADGRMKPDIVAPGERIVSCAAKQGEAGQAGAHYREESGTSMAAPHVSGAIAAFLSVRKEFHGRPDRVKEIFMQSATDLRRRPEFQGAGLVDLMRALQSV